MVAKPSRLGLGALLSCLAIVPATADAPSMKLSGYMQADFYSGDTTDASVSDSSFFLRRARLTARGHLAENVRYTLMGAYDAANSTTDESRVRLLTGALAFDVRPLLRVHVGQFKLTWDQQGRRGASRLPTITRSAATNALASRVGQDGASFRDVGVEIRGTSEGDIAWGYAAGVVNGNGMNFRDDNGAKDLYGRLHVEPVDDLTLGVGYFAGKARLSDATTEADETQLTVDLFYEDGPLAVTAAYYSGDFDTEAGPDREPEGWNALAAYRFDSELELVVRRQEFEADSAVPGTLYESTDVGLNYYMKRKGRWGGNKISVLYQSRDAEAGASTRIFEERGSTVTGDEVDDVILLRLQMVYP